jgi:hypothetical protein
LIRNERPASTTTTGCGVSKRKGMPATATATDNQKLNITQHTIRNRQRPRTVETHHTEIAVIKKIR